MRTPTKTIIHFSYFKVPTQKNQNPAKIIAESVKKSIIHNPNNCFEIGNIFPIEPHMPDCKRVVCTIINNILQKKYFQTEKNEDQKLSEVRKLRKVTKILDEFYTTFCDLNDKKIRFSDSQNPEFSDACVSHILIHLGFIQKNKNIMVVQNATNNADFNLPDCQGNQPWQEQIDPNLGIFDTLASVIDFKSVQTSLDPNRLSMDFSNDCRTGLNNYFYFLCLWQMKKYKIYPGMVYLVDFDVIPQKIQKNLIEKLMIEVYKQWCGLFRSSELFEILL